MNKTELERLMSSVGFPSSALDIGSSIALAESGGNPGAIGPVGEVGLWQIYLSAHPQYTRSQMMDPVQNARAALAISSHGSSWRAWCTAYSDGACGTRGGTYLGNGSPYRKYLGGGTPGPPIKLPPPSPSGTPGGTPIGQSLCSSIIQTVHSVSDVAHETLNSVPGFVGIVEALDQLEQFQPLVLQGSNNLPDLSLLGLPNLNQIGNTIQSLTVPADTIQAVLVFITANIAAAFIRGILIFIGIVCIVALISNVLGSHAPSIGDLAELAA